MHEKVCRAKDEQILELTKEVNHMQARIKKLAEQNETMRHSGVFAGVAANDEQ